MGIFKLADQRRIKAGVAPAAEKPTGLWENVTASFNEVRDTQQSNSQDRLLQNLREERSSMYREITGSALEPKNFGTLDPEFKMADVAPKYNEVHFRGGNFAGIDNTLKKREIDEAVLNDHITRLRAKDPEKYKKLLTTEEMGEAAKAKAVESIEQREFAQRNATDTDAFWGGFIGSVGGFMTDPLNVATLPLGAGAGRTILSAMKIEAGVQATVEAAIQPSVVKWQEELGQEYGVGDALANIAGAAAFGGIFTGVIRGAKPTAQAAFSKLAESPKLNALQKQGAMYMSRVAHFREANPNVRATSETDLLHRQTLEQVSIKAGNGENISVAELPMSNRDFNAINSEITSITKNVDKPRLIEMQKFQGFDAESLRIRDTLDELKSQAKVLESTVSKQKTLVGRIRQLGGVKSGSDFAGELADLFEGKSGAFTLRKEGKGLDVLARELEDEGLLIGKGGEAAQPQDLLDELDLEIKGLKRTEASEGLVDIDRAIGELESRGILKDASIEDIKKTLQSEDIDIANEANRIISESQFVRDIDEVSRIFDTSVRSPSNEVPTTFDPEVPPVAASRAVELADAYTSTARIDAENTNFKAVVDADPNARVTLEDGTEVSIKDLTKSFEEDEKLLQEITTCAVG